MQLTEKLDLSILPEEAKKELLDFYEYLKKKYKIHKTLEELKEEILADEIQIDTKKWKFNREEIHDR